jgi:hypothetical protein
MPDVVVDQTESPSVEKPKNKTEEIFQQLEKKAVLPQPELKDYKDDYQLTRAIELIKAIKVYKNIGKQN